MRKKITSASVLKHFSCCMYQSYVIILIILCAQLCCATDTYANNSQDAVDIEKPFLLFESRQYTDALEAFNNTDIGNGVSEFYAGYMNYHGIGVIKNTDKAIRLLKISASKENVEAKYWLGKILLEKGDRDKGIRLIEQSAYSGYLLAQVSLAVMYFYGKDIGIDNTKARIFSFLASNRNNGQSELILSHIYAQGKGLKRNSQKALYWMRRAVKHGEPYAQYLLGMMYKDGIGVDKDIDEAIRLLKLSALNGNKDAEYEISNNWK